MTGEPEILVERRGRVGLLTLNRPAALNALTHAMVRAMRAALDAWARDPDIVTVVLRAAGERAFCAGGDIRALYDLGRAGRTAEALLFWREEYELDHLISIYPKPYVSLIEGIVMGGGVGISLHGRYRVAGERMSFAMPEVGIGFFPDVGATHSLTRQPGATGTWLALTGARIGRLDAFALGLMTHAAPASSFDAIVDELAAGGEAGTVLNDHCEILAIVPPHLADRDIIDEAFSGESVEEVLARLDRFAGQGSSFAAGAAATIRAKSPTSLKIAREQMRLGAGLTLGQALAVEFRIVSRIVEGHDFDEGVRAVIVDKDQSPSWRPASLAEVSEADVARYFAPLGDDELRLPEGV
jgi:enoyl-CoA hydratase